MPHITSSLPSRRDVLTAGAAGLGLLAAASAPFARRARAAVTPTRLVMLYLDGGCDTLNVVVPQAANVHATYLARRPQIAVSTANSLSLAAGPGTSAYRLHPSLPKTLATLKPKLFLEIVQSSSNTVGQRSKSNPPPRTPA